MNKEDLRILRNKILSYATALTMMATPVAANASGNNEQENTNEITYSVLAQPEVLGPLTEQVFSQEVAKINVDLLKKIIFEIKDLQCAYYLTNHEYIPAEDVLSLEGSVVHGTDVANGEFQNFADAYSLINEILDYNQSAIRGFDRVIDTDMIHYTSYDQTKLNKYLTKVIKDKKYNLMDAIRDYNASVEKDNPELVIEVDEFCVTHNEIMSQYLAKVVNEGYDLIEAIKEANEAIIANVYDTLIDVSELCYDENDRELVHQMHINYINAYLNGKFDNDDFWMVFKQLTTLNAVERAGDSHQISIGARWLAENVIGGCVMQMLRDHMQETYSSKELSKFFVAGELNKHNWILRDDVNFNINNPETELEVEVLKFGELWIVVYTNVNNDIMTSFANRCLDQEAIK